jgi:hypothetical protein
VRHGDRSNIGKLPGAPRAGFVCGEPSAARAARAVEDLRPFRSSVACLDAGGAGSTCEGVGGPPLGAKFDNALPAWGRARAVGEACSVTEGGELSSVGWAQLHAVGGSLARAYRALLAAPMDARRPPLHVHSTDTGRTAWSAAALVNGLLSELLPERGVGEAALLAAAAAAGGGGGGDARQRASASLNSAGEASPQPLSWSAPAALPTGLARAMAHNRSLAILLQGVTAPSGAGAVVPGLELPLPLHLLPRDEEFMLWPKKAQMCPRAAVMQFRAEEDIFQHQVLPADVSARIAQLARVSEGDVPTTEECADDLLTRRCHAHPRPCWGASGCLASSDEAAIIKRCDEGYRYRFSNEVTRLLTYPMLKQLVGQLRRAAALAQGGAGAPLPDGGVAPRLHLRSVHDTVIAPMLATLGALDPVYPWPNYASRVSLELWLLPRDATPQALLGSLPAGAPPGDAALLPLVRLLYNGEDVTARLACAVVTPGGGPACPLAALEAKVAGLLGGFSTWEEACATDEAGILPPPEEHAPNGRPRAKHFVHGGNDVGPGRG